MGKKIYLILFLTGVCLVGAFADNNGNVKAKYSQYDDLKAVHAGGFNAKRPNYFIKNWKSATIYYIPNRLMDLADAFSVQLNFGAQVGAELMVTEYFGLGGMYGKNYFIGTGINRQAGGGTASLRSFRFFCFDGNGCDVLHPWGTMREYVFEKPFGFADYRQEPYRDGDLDPWAISISCSWLLGLKLSINPIEFGDFIAGFALLDFKEDDI